MLNIVNVVLFTKTSIIFALRACSVIGHLCGCEDYVKWLIRFTRRSRSSTECCLRHLDTIPCT